MSIGPRAWIASSAVLLAAGFAGAAMLISCVSVEASPETPPAMTAQPAPVYVSPVPVAFDLESDNPAER